MEEKKLTRARKLDDIGEVFDVFYEINPTINWGNKTQRKAAGDMIKMFGLDNTLNMAKQIVMAQGQPYAPVITNPYQMKEKLAQFKIYFSKKKVEVFDGPLL